MLIQAAKYITEYGGQVKNFSLFGQEKNRGPGEYLLNLIGIEIGALATGQTITATPGLFDDEVLGFGGTCRSLESRLM